MSSYLDNFNPSVSKCYLCGKKIKSIGDLVTENAKEQETNFYHRNCFKFYNRLQIVYGKNISELGLEKVRWDLFSGNLFELIRMELKKSKINDKNIQYSKSQFFELIESKITTAKDEVSIVCSKSFISNYYFDFLKFLFKKANNIYNHINNIRILLPKDNHIKSLLHENLPQNTSNIRINYIHENLENIFFVVIDKNFLFFSEFDNTTKNNTPSLHFNTITENEYIVWYVSAIFESLWKQTSLENRVLELYEEQNKKNVSRENFIRMFVHELKVPLQPIIGFSDMIQSNNRLSTEQKNDILKIISRNAKKLDLLANNILDYARMENNIFKLNIESTDIIKIIKELIDDYQIQADKKGLSIEFVHKTKEIVINLDKVRIIEVLDNLLSNALKFTQKGFIRISIAGSKDFLNIYIMDTGIGIGEKNKEKLFSKFFTTDTMGTGLGLYISKMIVEKHGGKIDVQNNFPHSGCTFSISLPISKVIIS